MIPENKKTKNILFKTCKNLTKIPMTRWFYFFHAVSNATGEKFPFFIEIYIVNFSKCKTSMTFSTRNEKLSEAQMSMEEASLFCTPVQQVSKQKKKVAGKKTQPAYIAVRAGKFGTDGTARCVNNYFSAQDFKFNKANKSITLPNCIFSQQKLIGEIFNSKETCIEHPEFFSQNGSFFWNLEIQATENFKKGISSRNYNWLTATSGILFSGELNFDGISYTVDPSNCSGYIQKNWGKDFPKPFITIACSNLTSLITGRRCSQIQNFSIQGVNVKKLNAIFNFQEKHEFLKKFRYKSIFENTQILQNDEEKQLHCTISFTNRKFVIDIDAYCKKSSLNLKKYESLSEEGKVFSLLESGDSIGEVRIYRKIKKTLELIEHLKFSDAFYSFGAEDESF